MTTEDIRNADAGQLRLLVAEHVTSHLTPFTSRPVSSPSVDMGGGMSVTLAVLRLDTFDAAGNRLPAYSTEMGAAWLVVEAMRRRGYCFCLSGWQEGEDDHHAEFWRFGSRRAASTAGDESMPAAICCAALSAIVKEQS